MFIFWLFDLIKKLGVSKMERLIIGYALVLLICVWLYPQKSLQNDVSNDSAPVVNQSRINSADAEEVTLPKSKYPRFQGAYTLTQLIKKDERCKMTINEKYESDKGEKVQILAKVDFPAGSVDEDTEITMVIDNKTGVASFFPKVNLNKTAIFSLEIYGANKSDIGVDYFPLGNTLHSVDVKIIYSKFDDGSLAVNLSELSDI
jgi:hypothetical protein